MDRKSRIMMMALSDNKRDKDILRNLKIQKYETTKGLDTSEINVLLSGCHKLFNEKNDDRHCLTTPYPERNVQIEEISSTEKGYVTRLRVQAAKRKLFCKHSSGEDCNSENVNIISSTGDELIAADSYEDSGDEYVPHSETSDSESDNDSDGSFSKRLLKKAKVGSNTGDQQNSNSINVVEEGRKDEKFNHKRKKIQCDNNTKDINYDSDIDNISTDDSDLEIKMQDRIIIRSLNGSFPASVGKSTEVIDNRNKHILHTNSDHINQNSEIQEEVLHSGKKLTKRVWNKKDHCFFCDTDVMKFSRHVLRHHQSEIEVQEILALKVRDKRRKHLFNKLRNKGNFLESFVNENVVPVRKPAFGNLEPPNTSTFLPCKYCNGFYKKKYLYRHVKKCPHNSDDKTVRINAQSEGQSLLSAYNKNDILRKEIFPTMRADTISFTAKTDPLICAVARRYLKSHRDKQFRLVASRKMRQLAALLIEIKKKIKVKGLLNALDPLNFDTIVKCTKIICKYDAETETYGAPSIAAHMGTELKDCIDVACNMSIKRHSQETEVTKKLKSLKELIVSEWRYEVSTIANNDLQQKKWNKPSLIPLAEDLTLLKAYLLAEGEKCRNALKFNPNDENTFRVLVEISYVQVLLLNRRRVGELQRMTVIRYTTNINNQSSKEFDGCISESEKILMRSFKRVVIRGKRGRPVPVLFTEEMVKNTDLLLKVRNNFVRQKNIYLFANTRSSTSISGTRAIYKHVRLAGAKNAAALTSTKLRKHLATMSQVINLSEQDLEQLANFMGHTSEIHKTYYRLPSDVYQTAKISKLLLLNERGEAAKYKGKRLDEIQLDLSSVEEHNSDDDNEMNDAIQQGTMGETNENQEQPHSSNSKNILMHEVQPRTVVDASQKKNKRILEPWTDNQKEVTLSYFKKHLRNKIPPKKNECLQLQNENPGLFANKSWEKIKIYVVNTYNKGK